VLASVAADNQNTFLVDLARAEALTRGELALDGAWVQIEDLPLILDVLLNHAHVQTLDRVDVLASFVVDSAKNENLLSIERT